MRWNGDTAIVIVANRNLHEDAHLRLDVPVGKFAQKDNARFKVTDLWNGSAPKEYSSKALVGFSYTVRRDKSSPGGIGLLKIERVN